MKDILGVCLEESFREFFCTYQDLCPLGNGWHFCVHREEFGCLRDAESFCLRDKKIVASVVLFGRPDIPVI